MSCFWGSYREISHERLHFSWSMYTGVWYYRIRYSFIASWLALRHGIIGSMCIYSPYTGYMQLCSSGVRLYFRICTLRNWPEPFSIQAWTPGETFSISSPPTYLVNIVAIHTNYQLHEIVADFLGQRTSAEAQFDESSQEGTRKKVKGHAREEFLRKSTYACCKFWILGTV